MKTVLLSDEINQLHWGMLKSIGLILGLLPVSQGSVILWQLSDAASQIMVGFMMLSLFSALLILSFWTALKTTVQSFKPELASPSEHILLNIYRQVPMLTLAAMLSYLVTQF